MPRPSPLHDTLAAAGARLAERDGWLVATGFGDPEGEHRAARDGAAMADASARGLLRVEGRDAAKLLQSTVSNDVEALALGEARYALLLTPKGRIVADMDVLRLGAETFLLVAAPDAHDPVALTLRRYRLAAKADIADARGEVAQLQLLGAAAVPDGIDADVVAGPLGPRLVGAPDVLAAAWDVLVAAGVRPAGADALELLRVETGVPRLGAELDESVFPAEAGVVARGVSFTKGCYVGQEPVARLHYRGHPNRSLRRLAFAGEAPSLPAALVDGDREIGRVTSAVQLPGGAAVGLGYVRREIEDGAAVEVRPDGGTPLQARVEALGAAAGSPA